MRLSEARSRELLHLYGAYVTEACDRCGAAIGPNRWTICGEPGAWCSKKCRDGAVRRAGVCQGCGVSINGKKKHARFCSDVCRKRQRVREQTSNPETPLAD
jgi:hypothetical protein